MNINNIGAKKISGMGNGFFGLRKLLQLAVIITFTFTYANAQVIIPAGSTITDPIAQGYVSCTPTNCVIATTSSTGSLPTATLPGQGVFWNGTTWEATSSLQVNGATPTATTNNIFVSGLFVNNLCNSF